MNPTRTARFRKTIGGLAATSFLGAALVSCTPIEPGPGSWESVQSWPIVAVHMALTPEGDVISFGTDTNGVLGGAAAVYDIWDPNSGGHNTVGNPTSVDLFCATQVMLPGSDDILTAGGDNGLSGYSSGTDAATLYSKSGGLREIAPMATTRWYATGNTLPNGDIVVEGGSKQGLGGPAAMTPEVYSPSTGWRTLSGVNSDFAYGFDQRRWWYPRSWVAPDGRMFGISGSNMYYLNTSGNGSLTQAGTFPGGNIGATSTAVMYRPGKILQVGGGAFHNSDNSPSSAAATIIDINSGSPVITQAAPMHQPRHWATATVLPDGRVLVTGGSEHQNQMNGVGYTPEIWNPVTDTWTQVSAEDKARLYHSSALLLPDGRVLSAGGGSPGPVTNLNAQIYSPDYLLNPDFGPRPTLSAPSVLQYGSNFSVGVSEGVNRITLVRAGAATHSFNSGQRFIDLEVSGSGTSLSVTAPSGPTVAPPGTYLMFALNNHGKPSVAQLVEFNP